MTSRESQTEWFLIFWFASWLAHYDQRLQWFDHPTYSIACLMALLGILFTRNVFILILAFIAQIVACWKQMPIVDNHWFFVLFVNLSLLILISVEWFRQKSFSFLKASSLSPLLPHLGLIRILTLGLYFFAVFHKLNRDFFDPSLSCATDFYGRVRILPLCSSMPELRSLAAQKLVVFGIFLMELMIPVLLVFRRTWFLGILVGVSFHLMTSLLLTHFPAIAFALYILFIPDQILSQFSSEIDKKLRKVLPILSFQGLVKSFSIIIPLAFFIAYLFIVRAQLDPYASESPRWLVLRFWSFCVLVFFLGWLVWAFKNNVYKISNESLFNLRSGAFLFVFIFLVNGFSPYLGLKTVTSISMWSNLLVKSEGTNHFLFGSPRTRVFSLLDDFVKIEQTNIRRLQKDLGSENEYSLRMLKRLYESAVRLNPEKEFELTVNWNGTPYNLEQLNTLEIWSRPEPYLSRKLIAIHDAPPVGRCQW